MTAKSANIMNKTSPFIRTSMKLLGINRAVFFGILYKGWPIVSGLVTIFLLITFFSPELQGYYYTFYSLLALQAFVELGLSIVVMQFASHEWANLDLDQLGNITGDQKSLSRLKSLAESSFKWYLNASFVLLFGLCLIGYIFFSQTRHIGINWLSPWFVLCFSASANLSLMPVFAILEGCGQISQIFFFRFIQGVLQSATVWLIIVLGGGLWALVGSNLILFIWSLIYLFKRYFKFFKSIIYSKLGPKISWRKEIWPMQWKIAISGLSGYFISCLFVPILFRYRGAAVAGQMGMTWSMVSALSTVASMWIVARAPQFGMLIAKKQFRDLDKLLFHSLIMTIAVTILGSVCIYGLVVFLYSLNVYFASRLLPPLPTMLFLFASVLMQISSAQSTYLRAHKQDPFVGLSVISALLLALLMLYGANIWGAMGVSLSYFIVTTFIIFPIGSFIWVQCRKSWHDETIEESVLQSEELK